MPNNLDLVPTLVNISPQQLMAATINIPPTANAPVFTDPVGEFFRILELEFPVKSSEIFLQLATFSKQKDETLKMLYMMFLKLKEDTQSITDLEAAHRYFRSLEGTPTLHAQVLQQVFAESGDSYTLLDVYNISEKLELAHAHYEASTMRFPSRSRPQPTPTALTRSSHSSSRTKAVHSATPILPFCNYCGNPAHKANECNIPFKDIFCDHCEKEGHQESVCFAKFPERKQLRLQRQNLQHLLLSLNQKPRHLSLPLRLCPPKVIPTRMLRRRSTMLTRGRCFKPMQFKFRLYKMNSNH